MSNSLRNLLLTATIGLSMPGAMAQSESFTGLSGNSYYVDYATGLVMQLSENDATVVSPQMVVESEFDPIRDKILYLANEHDITNEAFQIDKDNFQKCVDAWGLIDEMFVQNTESFIDASFEILQNYYNLVNILEQLSETRGAAKPAKKSGLTRAISTDFSFGISEIISDYDYAEFMVNFTREYLIDFEQEIDEFAEKLDESGEELNEISMDYETILNYHTSYILGLYEWLDQYADIASEDLLFEIAQDIAERVDDLRYDVENLPSNPATYVDTWAEICLDYMQSTQENYLEAYEELVKVAEKITLLRNNFAGVLFAGPAGDEAGLFYTILNDNGNLILPPFIYCNEQEYYVTGIYGNIFSGMPEEVTLKDLKIVLPSTIWSIKDNAFPIDGITEIFVYSTNIPVLDNNCFTEDTYANAVLYVRDNLVEDYKKIDPWNKFQNILPESMAAVDQISNIDSRLHIEGDTLIVNATAGTPICVYGLDGRTVYTGLSNHIKLPSKGLYIVKVGSYSAKIKY